ncbi:transposase [Streptomyces sp. NBC_01476]|uniref:transposase n=1 Tax=Streptomyces sp. NBC_01476 TaxID=2903881 RepID=UPI002E369E07|nr:transposase [Streptomyces sp. NBC_01476]
MAMKDYSDEFKADAVALYESTPGATYKSIAADLGVNRATLRAWVLRDRERRGVTATAAKPTVQPGAAVPSDAPDERIRQLEARVAELEASEPPGWAGLAIEALKIALGDRARGEDGTAGDPWTRQ